jgi:protease II
MALLRSKVVGALQEKSLPKADAGGTLIGAVGNMRPDLYAVLRRSA